MKKSMRKYEEFMDKGRENFLKKVEEAYEDFKETKTLKYPEWQYGEVKGKIIKLEVEDTPKFGQNAYIELDSARTAFISVDMQTDFAGEKGYVDVMGYDLNATAAPIKPIKKVLDTIRGTDIKVVHTREGHLPDLSDAPFNKVLRSKIIGKGVGIGETPEGGLGKLLVRGEPNWDIVDELYPIEGEYIVDKEGKGAFSMSNIHLLLKNLGVTHLVITGITTDVCVHTIMREANDYGYWCILLKDCTGATDEENYKSAIKSIKMQGGVFGNVSDSETFIKAVKEAGLK